MKEQYYLDNAATTWPKPEVVYTSMDQLFRQFGVNPGRAGHEMAVEAERIIFETRRLLAGFFNFVIFYQFHVPAARSVTVFTLVPFQKRKPVVAAFSEFLDLKSGIITEDALWIPTCDMAREAFRIVSA